VEVNEAVVSAETYDDDDDDDVDNDVTAACDAASVCSATSQSCTTTNSKTPLIMAGYTSTCLHISCLTNDVSSHLKTNKNII